MEWKILGGMDSKESGVFYNLVENFTKIAVPGRTTFAYCEIFCIFAENYKVTMYEYQGLSDALFMALYGAVAMMALLGGLDLMFARGNVVAEKVAPPKALRRWAAAFMAAVVASHVWWFVLGMVWLSADRVVRDTVCIALDLSTLVPLMMAVLLRLLQDRRRLVWPWFAAQLPVVAMAVWGIARGDMSYATGGGGRPGVMVLYQMAVILLFLSGYVHALRQYGRWLRDNYADLEHKEVWQSLVVIVAIVAVYCFYTTNGGSLLREYISQLNSILIIAFVVWRVEALSNLTPESLTPALSPNGEAGGPSSTEAMIDGALKKHCEETLLYLQSDLTLAELARAVCTNRTYLSAYFAGRGITYYGYINRLRIDHFCQLYSQARAEGRTVVAKQLATECGYATYRTFADAFRAQTGKTPTEWMRSLLPGD